MRTVVAAVLICAVCSCGFAADVSIRATATPQEVRVDDTFRYEIEGTIEGMSGLSIPRPELPSMDAFEIVGTSSSQGFTMGSDGVRGTRTFTYVLRAREPGEHTIEPARLEVQGQIWEANRVHITVLPPARSQPSPPASQPEQEPQEPQTDSDFAPRSDIDLVFEANPEDPYVGEQFLITFRLYHSSTLYGEPHWPQMSDLIVKELPRPEAGIQAFNNRRYMVEEWRWAAFATREGPMEIEPVVISARKHHYGPKNEYTSNPLNIWVKPLPPAPAGRQFEGAVGEFTAEMSADKSTLKSGETFTVTVHVAGRGNIHGLGVPTPQVPDWCSISQTQQDQHSRVGYGGEPLAVGGTVTVDFLVLPKQAGELRIPPLEFVYFAPDAERYKTAKTEAVVVTVQPGETAVSEAGVTGPQLRHIHTGEIGSVSQPLALNTFFWILQAIPLLALIGLAIHRYRAELIAQNPDYARSLRAPRVARQRLQEAHKALKAGKADRVCSLVSHAVTDYIAMRSGMDARDIPDSVALQRLRECEIEEKVIAQTEEILDRCGIGRFAGSSEETLDDLIGGARQLISKLQRSGLGGE
ncbi:MAG: BatD family protein [Armatimonadota bacterium]